VDQLFNAQFRKEFGDQASSGQLIIDERELASESDVSLMMNDAFAALTSEHKSVIHCAGMYDMHPAAEYPQGRWDEVLNTNATLSFLVSQHFAKRFLGGSGSIVLLASVAHARGDATEPAAAYAASKGAIVSLTRQLATEWGPRGIRVNAIAPGVIDTAMTTLTHNEEAYQRFLQALPLGRIGDPAEVAAACLFLSGPEASYITGATLTVDGGYLAS
jgi:gluconate 5-dehydrogenase